MDNKIQWELYSEVKSKIKDIDLLRGVISWVRRNEYDYYFTCQEDMDFVVSLIDVFIGELRQDIHDILNAGGIIPVDKIKVMV